jgi:hypothetical protein
VFNSEESKDPMEAKLEGLFTETRQFVKAIQENENELKKLLD